MNKFYLIVNMDKDPDLVMTNKLCEYFNHKGKEYSVKKLYPFSDDENMKVAYCEDVPADTDLIIILGGDGSFLHSAVSLAKLNIPVAGLNLGTLGYLAQFNTDNFEEDFDVLLSGNYFTEDRVMILGELIRDGRAIKQDISLNDIVIRRCDGLSAIKLNIRLNGLTMKSSISDGLIVATPTGSTAYSLSVGGAIVEPASKVFAVTPIAPHSLSDRSVIVSDDSEIEVELADIPRNENADVLIGFDGKFMTRMINGDILRIKKSDDAVRLIRLDGYNFFDVMHSKMCND